MVAESSHGATTERQEVLSMKNRGSRQKKIETISALKRTDAVKGYLFLSPFIIGFFGFIMLPILTSIGLSFTNWNTLSTPRFCGADNYVHLLTENPYFWGSLSSTLLYALGGTVLPIIWSLLMALALNANIKLRAFFRTCFYIPCLVPVVSTSILWMWMYNPEFGLFNNVLDFLHLPRLEWIYNESTVIPSLWLMAIWGCGSTVVVFLASLQGIPTELMEAVEMDGGGALAKFHAVTLPFLSPILSFNFLMGIIGAIQVYAPAAIMTGGGPNNKTLFLTYYIYGLAFSQYRMGYACALAVITFIVILFFTGIFNRLTSKLVFYNEG